MIPTNAEMASRPTMQPPNSAHAGGARQSRNTSAITANTPDMIARPRWSEGSLSGVTWSSAVTTAPLAYRMTVTRPT